MQLSYTKRRISERAVDVYAVGIGKYCSFVSQTQKAYIYQFVWTYSRHFQRNESRELLGDVEGGSCCLDMWSTIHWQIP